MVAMHLADPAPAAPSLLERARILLAAGIIWYGLHFVKMALHADSGWNRPPVFIGPGGYGVVAGVLSGLVLIAGVFVARFVSGRSDLSSLLATVGLSLAIFAAHGGTMDDWLKRWFVAPGAATGAPYSALLADYGLFAAITVAIIALCGVGASPAARVKHALGLDRPAKDQSNGWLALATATAGALLLMTLLCGPRVGATLRGQIYFAAAIAPVGGVYAANALTSVRDYAWYWPVPILVGVIGLIVAMFSPALPAPYTQINVLPAWGGARALPIETIGLGFIGVHWMVRQLNRGQQTQS